MISKWTFIKRVCEAKGYNESAKVAKEINDMLKKCYGKTLTKSWVEYYDKELKKLKPKDVDDDLVWVIKSNGGYCIACNISNYNCSKCKFSDKTGGICGESSDSLYKKFKIVFKNEHINTRFN